MSDWRVQYTDGTPVFVGHEILFDHFGSKARPGRVIKITAGAVHVEWTAPSSGKTRVLKLSTKEHMIPACTSPVTGEFFPERRGREWSSKNPRLCRAQEAK